jgi:hypothetical protein
MTVGISSTDVHLRVGETSGHGRARRAGADDQLIHGIVHAGLSSPGAGEIPRRGKRQKLLDPAQPS